MKHLKLTFKQKLLTAMLLVGLIPLLVNGYLTLAQTSNELKHAAIDHLDAVREIKKHQVENYFSQIQGQIQTMAENTMVVSATKDFTSAFNSLTLELDSEPKDLEKYRSTLQTYYRDQFGAQYEKQTRQTIAADELLPQSDAGLISQNLYLVNNSNPLGSKHQLDTADDDSLYSNYHAHYHPIFRNYLEKFGYYDIFLVNANTGNVIYSVFKEIDYATSLNTGPHSDSQLGAAFRAGLNAEKGATHITDFKSYQPSYEAPAAFISSPVFNDDGQRIGVLVFQMPVDKINAIMQEKTGMGETGESYLIGEDMLMRSQSRFHEEPTIGIFKVDTEGVHHALEGTTGNDIHDDYRGIPVLSSYTPVAIEGLHWALLTEIDKSEALQGITRLRNKDIVIWAVSAFFIIAAVLLMLQNLFTQLGADPEKLAKVANAIADNDLNVDMSLDGKKATGVFASINTMRNRLRKRKKTEEKIQNEIQEIVSATLQGDLSQRIDLSDKQGFFKEFCDGLNQLVNVCGQIIDDTIVSLDSMAKGNLTHGIEAEYAGSFGKLKDDVNATINKLTDIMNEINSSAGQVLNGAQEISHGNSNLSQRTEEGASNLKETASSMEEMTSTVKQNADNARQADELAANARKQAEQGGQVVSKAVTAMTGITDSSNKIAAIIGVIDEIAFQTNLLALNAAVEAARAGEQGRGFAVVASEVRTLAGRSATAAKEIKGLIEDSVIKVEEGSKLVDASGQTLEKIMISVKKVSDIIAEIAAASLEQSEGIEQVNQAISQMDEMTQQNAALVEQAAAASESMDGQARNLNGLVSFFKTDSNLAGQTGSGSRIERRKADRPWSGHQPADPQPVKPASQPKKIKAIANSADKDEWEEF